jgi:tRNA 5-methylaminomethyl-2-thiouridine biosynthesis bifunctional protein
MAARIERSAQELRVLDAHGAVLATGDNFILANGHTAATLIETGLALRPVRGQISLLPAHGAGPTAVVCQEGYVTPSIDGFHIAGATFDEGDDDVRLRDADHRINLARAQRMMPDAFGLAPTGEIAGWVGLRCVSRDRRPVLGPLSPGLYACLALGSRGFTWAPLAAEIVASALSGAPLPVPRSVARALSPARFETRQSQ